MSTHARWSASSSERNIVCPGNIALKASLPHMPSGYAAEWGTACHDLAAQCLNSGRSPAEFVGQKLVTPEGSEFWVDEAFVECADVYVDYIRDRIRKGFRLLGVEMAIRFDNIGARMDAGGTGDCFLYHDVDQHLELVDLKTGKGVRVEVLGNTQTRCYAIGGMLLFPQLPVKHFTSTIVQPRMTHIQGRVRSEVLDVVELFDWSLDLLDSINLAADAWADFAQADHNSVLLDEWTDKYLHAGEQCEFCPAKGGCPKLRDMAFKTAGAEMGLDGQLQTKSNKLADNAPAVVERDLGMLDILEDWIAGRRALAHQMAKDGHQFEDWTLVEKLGHRKFAGATDADVVKAIRGRMSIADNQLYDPPKLKSPAGLERAIGKKVVGDVLGDLIVSPVTGTDLVRKDKVAKNRRAVQSTVERFYQH